MNRTPVTSSNVASVGYDHDTLTLEVEFKSGAIYHYSHVPARRYEELMAAPSAGKYLNEHIKPVYTVKKVA